MISSILAATAMPALAAAEGRGIPSEPIVWGFLGFCALIIIAQLLTMTGNVKNQSTTTDEHTKAVK